MTASDETPRETCGVENKRSVHADDSESNGAAGALQRDSTTSSSQKAVVPLASPLELTSVWQLPDPQFAAAALGDPSGPFVYRREGHPNARRLADELARLHGADHALVTAQGMSAIAAAALACLAPGKQAWIGQEMYGKTTRLFVSLLTQWGVRTELFDPTRREEIDRCVNDTPDLVAVETISNPRLRIPDLKYLAEQLHHRGGRLLVDNTFATHGLCRPLDYGADLVVESLSKQVCGHSDSMLGLVCTRDEQLFEAVFDQVTTLGMASSPLDCYLTQRGLASLDVRLDRACQNAATLARELSAIDRVSAVDYPGLQSHPQHQLARSLFGDRFGWMLSVSLDASPDEVHAVFKRLSPDIPFAPSLGDVRTTVSHPVTTSHRGYSAEQLDELGIHYGTIRISCGIESTDWLVPRFLAALKVS